MTNKMFKKLCESKALQRFFTFCMVVSMMLTLVPPQAMGFGVVEGQSLVLSGNEAEVPPDGVPDHVLYDLNAAVEFFEWAGIAQAPEDPFFFWPILPDDFPVLVQFVEIFGIEALAEHATVDELSVIDE